MMNPEKDKTMVQELLEFKDNIDSIIKQSFNSEDCVDVKKVSLVICSYSTGSMISVRIENSRLVFVNLLSFAIMFQEVGLS